MPRGDKISMYYGNRRSEERRGPAKLIVKGSARKQP